MDEGSCRAQGDSHRRPEGLAATGSSAERIKYGVVSYRPGYRRGAVAFRAALEPHHFLYAAACAALVSSGLVCRMMRFSSSSSTP